MSDKILDIFVVAKVIYNVLCMDNEFIQVCV